MEIKTLSSSSGIPFTNVLEEFFDTYTVDEDIECYQFVFCPIGNATSFDDLNKIQFKSRVVIFNVIDTFVDSYDNTAIEELKKFCEDRPEQNFIISTCHLNLQKELQLPNLYLDSYIPSTFSHVYVNCEKKDITNRWVLLNSTAKLHRMLTVCYLLSKDYCRNGDITFDASLSPFKFNTYKNMMNIPTHKIRGDIAKGYVRFKSGDYEFLDMPKMNYVNQNVVDNYNTHLVPFYENVGVELITGTMFFEKTPVLSEKEIQSICGKNFPIYINGVGMAKEMKKFFNIDIFEDIVDHSYDEIENHFERLAAAIDRNQHLLDGSINIKELWYDNQKRFQDNFDRLQSLIQDQVLQRTFNHNRIKKGLTHFNCSFKETI
jgi:hypothetical protein